MARVLVNAGVNPDAQEIAAKGRPKWPEVCTVSRCNRKSLSRGYCRKHYDSVWRLRVKPKLKQITGPETGPVERLVEGHIVLCEECFPNWAKHNPLNVVPEGACEECGAFDLRLVNEVACHIFKGDPRCPSKEPARA